MIVLITPRFDRAIKRLLPAEKRALDSFVKVLIDDPAQGVLKKAIYRMSRYINLDTWTADIIGLLSKSRSHSIGADGIWVHEKFLSRFKALIKVRPNFQDLLDKPSHYDSLARSLMSLLT